MWRGGGWIEMDGDTWKMSSSMFCVAKKQPKGKQIWIQTKLVQTKLVEVSRLRPKPTPKKTTPMKYHPLLTLIFLLSLPTAFLSSQPGSPAAAERIQQMENSLMPGIVIAGREEASRFNIHDRMRHHKVPGLSIAFVDNGQVAWTRCYGYLSQDSLAPVDSLTLFQAASISKPVAALAALRLVQDGKLRLDEDVNRYLQGWQVEATPFTEGKPITLEHLLTHTAGLTVHGFGGYAQGDSVPPPGTAD